MSKVISKFLPVELYDMRGLEEWLSAMAAQGLHLAYLGQYVARFEPGPPRPDVRYALDVIQDWDGFDPERNENYAEMGWDYVTTLNNLYCVYRSQDPSAPALHTDPVTQSYTFKWLLRRRFWWLLFIVPYCIFSLWKALSGLFINPWSALELLLLNTAAACLLLVFLICYVLLIIGFIRQWCAMRAIQKLLAGGVPLEDIRRRPRRVPRVFTDWGVLAFIVCFALIYGFNLRPQATQELSGPEDWRFPHVTLEQALSGEDVTGLIPENPYDAMLHPSTRSSSLLAPEQIYYQQYGNAIMADGSRQECGVMIDLYRLRFPDTAPLLLRCVQESRLAGWRRYEKISGDISMNPKLVEFSGFQDVERPGFDQLSALTWRTEDEASPQTLYAGRAGDLVFTLTCFGPADVHRALDIFTEEVLS